MTQGILTAKVHDIAPTSLREVVTGVAKGDWSSMKRELGSPMCSAISDWLKSQKSGKGGINIVIADFVEESDFIKNVLALNNRVVNHCSSNLPSSIYILTFITVCICTCECASILEFFGHFVSGYIILYQNKHRERRYTSSLNHK